MKHIVQLESDAKTIKGWIAKRRARKWCANDVDGGREAFFSGRMGDGLQRSAKDMTGPGRRKNGKPFTGVVKRKFKKNFGCCKGVAAPFRPM